MVNSIGQKSKEDLFNELCAEHENDWTTEMQEDEVYKIPYIILYNLYINDIKKTL